jgi:carboxypeptidase family protein
MCKRNKSFLPSLTAVLLVCAALAFVPAAQAQQTLGGITGTVTDPSGGAVPDTVVTLVAEGTKLTRTQKTNQNGAYEFVDLPIGTYTLTFTHDGFQTQKVSSVTVQAYRTATLNVALKVGMLGSTVTVEASALIINAVDTTNGYILEKNQIDAVPLPTGSFTGLAILAPGVNAELESGTGTNNGLGNQPIWANGQRDTSNTFMFNGVDASNLFNGKSTSSVASARVVNATGLGGSAGVSSTSAEPIQSTSAPYLAIGQALPTPPPETIEEFRVNTSMYDAQQGSTSGAHIDMSTASGTNTLHGSLYDHHGTDAFNAAPFFYNADGNIPAQDKVPKLHRDAGGGTLGGPIRKDKLFGFISYQHIHDADQEIGSSRVAVPPGLTDDRSPAALAALVNGSGCGTPPCNFPGSAPINVNPTTIGTASGDINPLAYGFLNFKLPNGQFLIPSAGSFTPTINFPENTFTLGTAYFLADQAVSNLDWNVSSKDALALKYYYQHDPSIAPYAYSGSPGFSQHLDAGSQVASITNTQTIKPNLSVVEVFGFIREKIFSTIDQPFTPQQFSSFVQSLPAVQAAGLSPAQTSLNTFGSTFFPGFTILDDYGNFPAPYNVNFVPNAGLTAGMGSSQSQGAFTGVFQNRFMPSANAIWTHGKHTATFGGSFAYTQLNTRDQRTNKGIIGFADFSQFLQGLVTSYTPDGFITTSFLQGNANRYYRSDDVGSYLQDKYQVRSNLSVTLGARFDYHGGLTEKNGRLFNFDPSRYAFDETSGNIINNGIIIAGNDPVFPSKGVSDSTLTGRQWGLGPRLGVAWSPKMFNNKLVVRTGWGMYYDRGELFTYLSPGFASGVIPGGPFGVSQTQPFVANQVCTAIGTLYLGFIPECDPAPTQPNGGSFNNPWGPALGPPPSGNPALIPVPNRDAIIHGVPPFVFANYNRANKLPYTLNQTLDIQWMPRNDLLVEIGYVGNLGRHGVIPIPFNQAQIATPSNPIHGQKYTYGYTVQAPPGCNPTLSPSPCAQTCTPFVTCGFLGLPDGTTELATYENGNVDLRVPFVGLSSQAESYTAAGISAYNALQTHVEKHLSHGLQFGFSYTFSHATDEQSALGLFFNGNNPLNLRSAYGLSDFDRKHVINFTYLYEFPKFFGLTSLKGRLADGWAIQGLGIIQSGQPYSIIDFSGAVGSIFYGTSDGITNPIVPLGSCTPSQALTGASGATPGVAALNASCFTLPLLSPGDLGGAIPAGDLYETNFTNGQRNIFRQPWQKRTDFSIVKSIQLKEHMSLKFSMDVFNVTNTPSFDIPVDNVSQNLFFNDFPIYGTPALYNKACDNTTFYSCPTLSGLGIVNKTIGGPRQIQMMLRFLF